MKIYINDIEFPLAIIQKKSELEKGLKEKTDINGCYFFMFNNFSTRNFWMKDCLIPLDIVFCQNNKIVKIFHDCQPCKDNCPSYSYETDGVLEMKGGDCKKYGIKEGDTFTFEF